MDACFEILVGSCRLVDGLDRPKKTRHWGDESFVEESASYSWGSHVRVTQVPVPEHVLARLPGELRNRPWCCLSVGSSGLDALEREARGEAKDMSARTLEDFLRAQLFDDEDWAAVFEWQCDTIDEVFESDVDQFLRRFRANLANADTRPLGFVAFHRAGR